MFKSQPHYDSCYFDEKRCLVTLQARSSPGNDGLFVCWRLSKGSCHTFAGRMALKFEILLNGELITSRAEVHRGPQNNDSAYRDFMKTVPRPMFSGEYPELICSESMTVCFRATFALIRRRDPFEGGGPDKQLRFIPYRPYVLNVYEIRPPNRELKILFNVYFISSDGVPDPPMNQKLHPTGDLNAMYLWTVPFENCRGKISQFQLLLSHWTNQTVFNETFNYTTTGTFDCAQIHNFSFTFGNLQPIGNYSAMIRAATRGRGFGNWSNPSNYIQFRKPIQKESKFLFPLLIGLGIAGASLLLMILVVGTVSYKFYMKYKSEAGYLHWIQCALRVFGHGPLRSPVPIPAEGPNHEVQDPCLATSDDTSLLDAVSDGN